MKKAMVYGGGVSGLAALELLKKNGYEVILVDDIKGMKKEEAIGYLDHIELFIKSPGIAYNELTREVSRRDIELIDEIELAYRFDKSNAKIIAITGTNGKTTTTEKIAGLLREANYKVEAGGNIGKAYAQIVLEEKDLDYIVLELSSYQLENLKSFRAFISLVINLSPDHLDRYDSLEDYYKAKLNITNNQRKEDYFIYNLDSVELKALGKNFNSKILNISSCYNKDADYFVKDGYIYKGKELLLEEKSLSLKGKHNLENIMFIVAVADIIGIDRVIMKDYLYTTKALEHRMEVVLTLDNISFINDSKGTNIDSTIKAIKAYKTKPILICGGKDKRVDLNPLADCIVENVKEIYLIGETANIIEKLLRDRSYDKIYNFGTLDRVIDRIKVEAGDLVLFSPAHSSFDQYKNYIVRGEEFKKLVLNRFGVSI